MAATIVIEEETVTYTAVMLYSCYVVVHGPFIIITSFPTDACCGHFANIVLKL